MTTTLAPAKLDNVLNRIHVHGLDEAAQQLAPYQSARYVQLERGPACFYGAAARLDHTIVGRWGADRNKVEWFDVPRGRMIVVMTIRGMARLGAASVMPGQAIVAHGPTQLVVYTDREHRALFASLPDRWIGRFDSEPSTIARPLRGACRVGLLHVSESRTRIFHRCIHRVLDEAAVGPTLFPSTAKLGTQDSALVHLCDSWLREQGGYGVDTSATARCHAAVRARQYIDDHLDQPLTLAAVCQASYSSARSLEYGFKEIFGVSPIAYIRCSRLSRVRRELYFAPQANDKIAQLAMKWGFWHPRQFSKDYYELFGELPSTTRGRVTGRLRVSAVPASDCDQMKLEVATGRAQVRELARLQ